MIDITQIQYDKLNLLHRSTSYTQNEKDFLVNMTNKFVEGGYTKKGCGCKDDTGKLKQVLYSWVLANKEIIEEQLAQDGEENN